MFAVVPGSQGLPLWVHEMGGVLVMSLVFCDTDNRDLTKQEKWKLCAGKVGTGLCSIFNKYHIIPRMNNTPGFRPMICY